MRRAPRRARPACPSSSKGAISACASARLHARRPAAGSAGSGLAIRRRSVPAARGLPARQRPAGGRGRARARRRTMPRSAAGSPRPSGPAASRSSSAIRSSSWTARTIPTAPGRSRARCRRTFPARRLTLVIGISADKDQARHPRRARARRRRALILTAVSEPRAPPRRPRSRGALPPGDRRVETRGHRRARPSRWPLPSRSTPIICVAGSLFLIGEVLAQRR